MKHYVLIPLFTHWTNGKVERVSVPQDNLNTLNVIYADPGGRAV